VPRQVQRWGVPWEPFAGAMRGGDRCRAAYSDSPAPTAVRLVALHSQLEFREPPPNPLSVGEHWICRVRAGVAGLTQAVGKARPGASKIGPRGLVSAGTARITVGTFVGTLNQYQYHSVAVEALLDSEKPLGRERLCAC
jgi:hypothetical protein